MERVLFDGTHGIDVNTSTRIRDQERAPIAADLKRAMREKSQVEEKTFTLTADVSEAHRQIPIAPQDWHLLGCQVRGGSSVYVNTVGTFGVASASYYWSRTAAALGRLSQYFSGNAAHTWHMVVADDYHLEAGGPAYCSALMVSSCAQSVVFLLPGIKLQEEMSCRGWDSNFYITIEVWESSKEELSGSLTGPVKWRQQNNFEEGLGRIMYVAGALEFKRPFLAPLYKFMNLHPRDSVRRVPAYVAFTLRYLATQVEECRHSCCASVLRSAETAPRVDAQASGTRTGVEGWWPVVDEKDVPDPARSPWLSLEVTKEQWCTPRVTDQLP